jgi:hypothetical protein
VTTVARKLSKIVGKIAGVGLKVFSVLSAMTVIAFLGIAVANPGHSLMQAARAVFGSLPLLYVAVIALFILIFIPLLFIHALGNVFLGKKPFANKSLATILGGIWILTGIFGVVFFATIGMRYQSRIETLPDYQETTLTPAISDFSKLIIEDGQNVTITNGATTAVEIHGMARDLPLIHLVSNGDTLTITRDQDYGFCLFCHGSRPTITITTPSLALLSAANASRVSFTGDVSDLQVKAENSSSITLAGTADSLEVQLDNASRLNAVQFIVPDAKLVLSNASRALMNVETSLSGSLLNASSLVQYGTAATENLTVSTGSRIEIAPSTR